jgi:hypothetical protein
VASHALAKLYQSSARPADAREVLTPALDGFSPTPEMPEIAEAQALLESLARRRRRSNRFEGSSDRGLTEGWARP